MTYGGLSQVLDECEKFGTGHGLNCTAKKSAVTIIIKIHDNITC